MVGPGIWQETLKNMKNDKCTLQYLAYGKKIGKRGKRDTHKLQNLGYGEKIDK